MSYLRNMVNDTETCRDGSEPSIAGNFRTLIAPPHDDSLCDQHPHPWSNLAEICGLLNFKAPNELRLADKQLFQHTLIKAGQHAHCIGQQFEMLYLVNAGFLKTVTISDHGQEVVLRFPMKGDLLRIPPKLDTCSAANWTRGPAETGHVFQAKLDTAGVATRGRSSGFTPDQ